MKNSLLFLMGLSGLTMAALMGPRGYATSQLIQMGNQSYNAQIGLIQKIDSLGAHDLGHPLAWGQDSLGNALWINSDYKLQNWDGSQVQNLASMSSFRQWIVGRNIWLKGNQLFDFAYDTLFVTDLNTFNRIPLNTDGFVIGWAGLDQSQKYCSRDT
jgi:hypothetical protein